MNKRGTISLVFDDGYTHILKDVVPLLNKYGMKGVFAIPLEGKILAEQTGFPTAPPEQWQAIKAQGHELAAHGVSHTALPKLSAAELERKLSHCQQALGATTLVYPGGAHNDAVVAAAKKHFRAARTVIHGMETIPPQDPMRLKTYNFTKRNFSLWKANVLATYAYLTNSWLIETYHMIADKENSQYAISPTDFAKHIRFLSRLPVNIRTIRDVIT